jgi:hypothetical protein
MHGLKNTSLSVELSRFTDVTCTHRYWENEKVRLAYRPVHMNTLDDEVESFPPKARVY